LGEALGEQELEMLLSRYADPAAIEAERDAAVAWWRESLGAIRVRTPVAAIDHMLNGWLPYQALSCRIWGRSAFYQSGGAYGYRDQLQDAGNLAPLWPQLTREQILLHAAHQFIEGDVLHWWHPQPLGRGLRTRFSDDLLWLPYVTSGYIAQTGDAAVLDEVVPFLAAPLLRPGRDEDYLKPRVAEDADTVYEHCCRALDRSLTRGAHGLPLMGCGDWNDGMNRVGREGRGESVWLGFFLITILDAFMPLVRGRKDGERAARYAAYRTQLEADLNLGGWDGAWFRRAYYDDGTPLGTQAADECRIDGLAQAWAVLSGAAAPGRAEQAMRAAREQLVSEGDGLLRLLTPPFVDTPQDPGYIKGYVAGIRENGGQYTHAACWMIAAAARLGWRDEAALWLERISPQWHDANDRRRYKVEPYVIAADIYGVRPHLGRGGWTWYTGAAGWAWRVGLEHVLGLRLEGGHTLVVAPRVPDAWPGFEVEYCLPGSGTVCQLCVNNPHGTAARVVAATLDGAPVTIADGAARLCLSPDGRRHAAVVTLGAA
jgi:cyclic beta-1,2-glucan synthetase